MGSHQQQLLRMADSEVLLYQRFDAFFRLRQWPVGTVLATAAEQSWLARPGQYLTLWAAFGGVPRN